MCYIQLILSDASINVVFVVCARVCVYAHVCTCPGRTEDGMRFPGTGSFRQLVVCPLSGPFNVGPSNEVSETLLS